MDPPTLSSQAQETYPLPSWNEGLSKQNILEFVASATKEDSADFIPAIQRAV